jgi:hypothetical protein
MPFGPAWGCSQYDESERVSDRERYIDRLEMICGLDFIVPGIAAAGQPCYEFVEYAERRIDVILE